MTAIRERQRERFYINKKTKRIAKRLYFQKARHFAERKTISVRFIYNKARHFTLSNFSWMFLSWHLYKKAWHFQLCEFFIYKNLDTSQKARQFTLRFHIQEDGHFALLHGWKFWPTSQRPCISSTIIRAILFIF